MLKQFIYVILFILLCPLSQANADISLKELIYNDQQPFHLKLLKALPEEAKIGFGPKNADNVIIEIMDYYCGFCKKIHPELIDVVKERSDVRVVFIQFPIISPSSIVLSKFVLAANLQNKGLDLHNGIFSIDGSLTEEKIKQIIKKINLDEKKLFDDVNNDQTENLINISSFLAKGIGVRGTPALFINESYYAGYIPKEKILSLLK